MDIGELIADKLDIFPPWLVALIIAILPFIELRGALPVALIVLKMDPASAFTFSVLGNMIPVLPILYLFPWVEKMMRRYIPFSNRFFDWLFARTRRKASGKVDRLQELGIILFVAIPLPITGAWTGSLIAYLFDLDRKISFLCVLAGVLIAGVIVLLITYIGFGFGIWGLVAGLLMIAAVILANYLTGRYFDAGNRSRDDREEHGPGT